LDEIGKMFWSVLVARLRTAGTLTRTDPALVELACRAYSTVRACHKAMDQDGLFFEAPNMTLMAHPGSKVAAQAETRLARILKELGLTPGSKVAAPAETKDDSDPWKGLLSVTG
jgi:P27 family predicted phage terminase small subunit